MGPISRTKKNPLPVSRARLQGRDVKRQEELRLLLFFRLRAKRGDLPLYNRPETVYTATKQGRRSAL